MKSTIQKKYLRRAKIIAYLLQLAPFTRMVALTGSLAKGEATEKSDIDFFVVAKKGRIWTCRTFVTMLVSLTGYRRHGNHIAGRICLNCYQTEDNLGIKPRNSYTASDYSKAKPLWETNNIYAKYIKINDWIYKKFKNKIKVDKPEIKISKILSILQKILEKIFDSNWLERKLKVYQVKRIKSDPRTKNSPKGSIFVSDKELRFHPLKED